jgi:hypothetical protein
MHDDLGFLKFREPQIILYQPMLWPRLSTELRVLLVLPFAQTKFGRQLQGLHVLDIRTETAPD